MIVRITFSFLHPVIDKFVDPLMGGYSGPATGGDYGTWRCLWNKLDASLDGSLSITSLN